MIRAAPRVLPPCLVCGAKSSSINFGVPTCPPCKAFFRRNAVKLKTHRFICEKDGDCSVTYESRRLCNCCRLAKCFRVGMQPSLILSDVERAARKELVEQNRRIRAQLETMDERLMIRPSTLLRLAHGRYYSLSSSDQALLTNIFAAHTRICVPTASIPLISTPISNQNPLQAFLNDCKSSYAAVMYYLKIVPQFHELSVDKKVRLMKENLTLSVHVNIDLLTREVAAELDNRLLIVFGADLANASHQMRQSCVPFLVDPILLKILPIIWIFCRGLRLLDHESETCHSYDETSSLFIAQNMYIELLWRYILSRSPNDQHAVRMLNKIVTFLLFVQRTNHMYDTYIQNHISEVGDLEPLMQSLWH